MAKSANIYINIEDEINCFSDVFDNNKMKVLYHLRKWPTTMAILVLQELALICIIDSQSIIDLHQYIGKEDFIVDDNERHYEKDPNGNILGLATDI